VLSKLQNVFRVVREWQARQQAIQELASLNDHQLADIGVERGSLADAVYGRTVRHRAS
jgi:uncharacterized protein YjiS (DUF1127 family)